MKPHFCMKVPSKTLVQSFQTDVHALNDQTPFVFPSTHFPPINPMNYPFINPFRQPVIKSAIEPVMILSSLSVQSRRYNESNSSDIMQISPTITQMDNISTIQHRHAPTLVKSHHGSIDSKSQTESVLPIPGLNNDDENLQQGQHGIVDSEVRHEDNTHIQQSSTPRYVTSISPTLANHDEFIQSNKNVSNSSYDPIAIRRALVKVISCILQRSFGSDDRIPSDPTLITVFHARTSPKISISEYLERIVFYTNPSNEALVQSLMYIDQILHGHPNFHINNLVIHRLLLTSILCAVKFFDDQYFNNAYYARVGGIFVKEMNVLEVEYLTLVNFNLFIKPNAYSYFYNQLKSPELHTACKCDCKLIPDIADSVLISNYQ